MDVDLNNDTKTLQLIVFEYSRDGKFNDLVTLLNKYTKHERKKLAEVSIEDQWSLFAATLNGHLIIVDYLCSECDVNINKLGSFKLQQNSHSSSSSSAAVAATATTTSQSNDVTIHFVTSFWVACVKGHLDIVKLLHEKYNADIDSRSDSYSTALRSACYMSNYDICKYLLENNANVNEPNLMGGTPLINSIQSLNLVNLLIDYNVNVNYQDYTGTTALHYAIQEYQHSILQASSNNLDVIKLLIQSGANPRVKNMYNEDAYRLASMKGDKQVLLYLIENTQPSIDVIVENLRLIGSFCLDYNENLSNAILLWQRAIRLQCMSTTSVSLDAEEFDKVDDAFYHNINDKYVIGLRHNSDRNLDDHNLYKYSCLVRSQILGKYHRESIYAIMKRGAHYADIFNYKLSIEYWNYALYLTINYKNDQRQQNLNKSLSNVILTNELEFYFNESLFIMNSLISLYIEIYRNKGTSNTSHENEEDDHDDENNNTNKKSTTETDDDVIKFNHLFDLYRSIETQIFDLIDYVHDSPLNLTTSRNYHELLRLFLNCLNLILNFNFKEMIKEKHQIFERIIKFIRQNVSKLYSPYKLDSTLLHLCFRKATTNSSLLINQTTLNDLATRFDILEKYAFPNLNIIKFLLNLNCGYHLNIKNKNNETPLFLLIKKFKKTVEIYSAFTCDELIKINLTKFEFDLTQEILNYSLNNGAHIDLYDNESSLLSNLLIENEFYINQLKYVKLACLCANIIKKFKIKFNINDLPIELRNFIEIH